MIRNLFSYSDSFLNFYRALGFKEVSLKSFIDPTKGTISLPVVRISSKKFLAAPYFSALFRIDPDNESKDKCLLVENASSLPSPQLEIRYATVHKGDSPHLGKVLSIVDIHESIESQISYMSKRMRSRFRRAVEKDWFVTVEGIDAVSEFSTLYFENMRRLGSPALPGSFFKNFLQYIDQSELLLCRNKKGEILGGAINLLGINYIENLWMCSKKHNDSVTPALKIYSFMIDRSIKQGMPEVGFGRSTRGSGVEKIKNQLGAKSISLYWGPLDGSTNFWEERAKSSLIKRAAQLFFKYAPKRMTKILGGWLSLKVY